MKNRDDALVRKILEYCDETNEAIQTFGDDEKMLTENKVFRNAVCMPILQIGELCKLISSDLRETKPDVDWSGWCGVRDIMAHQYTNFDYKKTWKIIKNDIPVLKEKLSKISLEFDREAIERISLVMNKIGFYKETSEVVYHRIIDGTGISMNQFSDEKIVEFIESFMDK